MCLRQPLSGPLPSLVALRGNLFAFPRPSWTRLVEILSPIGDPWQTPHEPPPTPSWPFVVLRGPSWISFFLLAPFVDLRFLGGPLSSPLQPLSGPLPSFVALRGNLFAFSRPSWTRLVEILSPIGDPWQTPHEPPPTPSWPFVVLRGPSWISFCFLAPFSWPFVSLANPSRAPANALVALCRP